MVGFINNIIMLRTSKHVTKVRNDKSLKIIK